MPLDTFTLINGKEFNAKDFLPGFSFQPGKSKRFEISPFQIPYSGLAKGTYELKAEIVIEDHPVGLIFKDIAVK